MSFINSIVNQVFVINMDKDKDRLDKIANALLKQNITFERMPGVPGKDIKNDKRLTEFCNSVCGDSVKGCALSHRNIWDIAYERNYDAILVFEDDADIPEDLSYKLQKIWDKRPANYDIISLGIDCYGRENNNICSTLQDLTNNGPKNINKEFIEIKGILGAHALIISRNAIQKLRSHKINGHIDLEITLWSNEEPYYFYAVDTFSIYQNDDEGSNNSSMGGYPYLLNSILRRIPISNTRGLDYLGNLSMFKIGFLKMTNFAVILFFVVLIVPPKFKFYILAYLVLEFFVRPSFSESKFYFMTWILSFLISGFIRGRFYRNFKKALY